MSVPTIDDLRVKLCYICREEEDASSPSPREWTHPCRCTLIAHESCLLSWIQTAQSNSSSEASKNALKCPQCKTPYELESDFDRYLVGKVLKAAAAALQKGNWVLGLGGNVLLLAVLPTATVGAVGICTGAVMTRYGAWAVKQFFGEKLYNTILPPDKPWPWTAYFNLFFIPLDLLINEFFPAKLKFGFFSFVFGGFSGLTLISALLDWPITQPWSSKSSLSIGTRTGSRPLWPPSPFSAVFFLIPITRHFYLRLRKRALKWVLGPDPARFLLGYYYDVVRGEVRREEREGNEDRDRRRRDGDGDRDEDGDGGDGNFVVRIRAEANGGEQEAEDEEVNAEDPAARVIVREGEVGGIRWEFRHEVRVERDNGDDGDQQEQEQAPEPPNPNPEPDVPQNENRDENENPNVDPNPPPNPNPNANQNANRNANQNANENRDQDRDRERDRDTTLTVHTSTIGRRIAGALLVPLVARIMGGLLLRLANSDPSSAKWIPIEIRMGLDRSIDWFRVFLGLAPVRRQYTLASANVGLGLGLGSFNASSIRSKLNESLSALWKSEPSGFGTKLGAGLRDVLSFLLTGGGRGGLGNNQDPVWWRNTVGFGAWIVLKDAISLLNLYLLRKEFEARRVKNRPFDANMSLDLRA